MRTVALSPAIRRRTKTIVLDAFWVAFRIHLSRLPFEVAFRIYLSNCFRNRDWFIGVECNWIIWIGLGLFGSQILDSFESSWIWYFLNLFRIHFEVYLNLLGIYLNPFRSIWIHWIICTNAVKILKWKTFSLPHFWRFEARLPIRFLNLLRLLAWWRRHFKSISNWIPFTRFHSLDFTRDSLVERTKRHRQRSAKEERKKIVHWEQDQWKAFTWSSSFPEGRTRHLVIGIQSLDCQWIRRRMSANEQRRQSCW